MATDSILLKTQHLTKVYPGIDPVYAVRDICLDIHQGEFLSIMGPSGSGKSTLMNILGLLDQPTEGSLQYHGEETSQWKGKDKSNFRNKEIGFIFQAHLLLPEFTALENLLIPSRIGGIYNAKKRARAKELLDRIGMTDRMNFMPAALSGGQNQRVAIARALMNDPRIVFADEPTGALDFKTGLSVYELLREINKDDEVTFVIVTHERSLGERSDRMIQILDGRIQSDALTPQTA
jgi:lipoprotein-releasing system ATP-binding protein